MNDDYAQLGDLPLESVGEQVSDLEFEEATDQAVALVQADRTESAARNRMREISEAVQVYGWSLVVASMLAYVGYRQLVNA